MLARLFDRILDTALALCVLAASAAIFAQVVFRYGLNQPLVWADEFAVLVFAWMTFIGAAVAQRTDSHIAIDSLTRLMPVRVQTLLHVAKTIAMLAVLALIAWQGLALSQRMLRIAYPAMGVSRAWLYATLPVCMPLIAWYMLRGLVARLRGVTVAEIVADDWNEP
jgi:TRAP-type transport system small permease protein